jgi:hypothetical protein
MQAMRLVSLDTAIPTLGLLKMTLNESSCASLRRSGAAGEVLRPVRVGTARVLRVSHVSEEINFPHRWTEWGILCIARVNERWSRT